MIISDLKYLETVSEDQKLVGGIGNLNLLSLNNQANVAIIGQVATAGAMGLWAEANATNVAIVGQNNTNA